MEIIGREGVGFYLFLGGVIKVLLTQEVLFNLGGVKAT